MRPSSGEVARVLGGGVVPGSVVLVAGDPGIGKSTLLLRLCADIAESSGQTLYVSGEESMAQVKIRADRLGISGSGLMLLQSTSLEEVLAELDSLRPVLAVVDSIQTVYDDSLASGAGSVAQIRECTRALTEWSKRSGVPLVLTGHVTKGGDIAGPRVLEHMVDVVLYLEGDPISSWRLLRSVKNRFGATNEVGVLEMAEEGLLDVQDPSQAFLSERREGAAGSVVVATLEGSRPLLVEVQALTNPSVLPAPRRVATGIEINRLLLVCAVLSRRSGMSLANQDVVVNVTGGLRISEPAADLGVALAIASSLKNTPVAPRLAAIGEIGLTGEVRKVPQLQRRVSEVARLGLKRCLVPQGSDLGALEQLDLTWTPVDTVGQAVSASMSDARRRRSDNTPSNEIEDIRGTGN
jgi:DNA repair protein RadA/Sms